MEGWRARGRRGDKRREGRRRQVGLRQVGGDTTHDDVRGRRRARGDAANLERVLRRVYADHAQRSVGGQVDAHPVARLPEAAVDRERLEHKGVDGTAF